MTKRDDVAFEEPGSSRVCPCGVLHYPALGSSGTSDFFPPLKKMLVGGLGMVNCLKV